MGSLLAAVLVALFVREDGSPADSRHTSAKPTELRRLGANPNPDPNPNPNPDPNPNPNAAYLQQAGYANPYAAYGYAAVPPAADV